MSITFIPVYEDLIDLIWTENRAPPPNSQIYIQPLQFAGTFASIYYAMCYVWMFNIYLIWNWFRLESENIDNWTLLSWINFGQSASKVNTSKLKGSTAFFKKRFV